MKRGFKGLSILLSIIMVFCLFAPYSVYADDGSEGGEGTSPAAINAGGGVVGTTQAGLEFTGGEEGKRKSGEEDGGDEGTEGEQWHWTYTLSASSNDTAMGTVSVDPKMDWCLFHWYDHYDNDELVTITANPKDGYEFDKWEYTTEFCSHRHILSKRQFNNHTHDIMMPEGNVMKIEMKGPTENKLVKAIFKAIPKYNVDAQVIPASGVGAVYGTGEYAAGATVSLTASAISTEYKFKQWSGNDLPDGVSITSSAISFAMPAKNISIKAEFEKPKAKFLVKVGIAPKDTGKFTVELNNESSSDEISKYENQINSGTSVTLTAVPSSALYAFKGWYTNGKDGVLLSANAKYTFEVDDKTDLIARFEDASGETEPVPAGQAIIRDFRSDHPDFQNKQHGTGEPGLVRDTLGTDGNPEKSSKNTNSIKDDISFAQWFTNVPGKNFGIHYPMSLVGPNSDGYYGFYVPEDFFPIDGKGFGNENEKHNYFFTLEYETKFNYDPAKRTIKVKSDDDLWIFIDGKLVVDLGGVHEAGDYKTITIPDTFFAGKSKGDPCTFKLFFAERKIVQSALAFGANFLAPYVPPVEPPTQYTLTTEVENGTISPTSGTKYNVGEVATITIAPDKDYEFDKWVEDNGYTKPTPKTGTDDYEVTMDGDKKVKAIFKAKTVTPIQYTLTTEAEHGTISPASGAKYNEGTVAIITISPDEGYEFDKWVEDTVYTKPTPKTGTDDYEVTMDSDKMVKAIFKAKTLPPIQYTLNTEVENGTISPASGAKYNAGTVATITITPNAGFEFDKWVEDTGYTKPTPKLGTDEYEVIMNSDIKVKAIFKQIRGAIFVYKDVVGKMLGQRSMADYEDITDNTVFTLTLTGSALEAPITRTISEDTSAEFIDLPLGTYYLVETLLPGYDRVDDPDNYTEITLTEEENGAELGVVNMLVKQKLYTEVVNGTISPASATEGLEYTRGTVVELTIIANSGFEFDKWINDEGYTVPTLNTTSQKYEVIMNSDIRVKALFKAISTPPVNPPTPPSTPVTEDTGSYTLLMAVVGQGTVSPGVGASLQRKGGDVQLSATPAEGWKFDGWQGDSVNAANVIRMDSNKSVTAVFSQITTVVNDEPAPQAPVSEPQIVEMDEEETPAAPADVTELPKTGGVPATVFYGLGGFIAAMGVALRSKTKKKEEEEE